MMQQGYLLDTSICAFYLRGKIQQKTYKTAKELVAITHKKGTLWYNLAKEKGLLEAFEKHECNNSSYVINFADAMSQ